MCGSVSKIFFSLCVALSVGTAYAATPEGEALDRQATTLYQQVFSPFCPGRSLNDCPSSKAAELKDQMRAELEAGKAPDVILSEVFQKYGDQYRAVPQFSGVGMFVWLVPIGFVVTGLVVAIAASSRRKRRVSADNAHSSATALSAEEERRIQEELSRLE